MTSGEGLKHLNYRVTTPAFSGGVAPRNWWRKLECPIRVIVQQAIRLRCFRKHKLKDHKGKERKKNIGDFRGE
jgi:hypothetical protein